MRVAHRDGPNGEHLALYLDAVLMTTLLGLKRYCCGRELWGGESREHPTIVAERQFQGLAVCEQYQSALACEPFFPEKTTGATGAIAALTRPGAIGIEDGVAKICVRIIWRGEQQNLIATNAAVPVS